jgi:hypothetical protein
VRTGAFNPSLRLSMALRDSTDLQLLIEMHAARVPN